MKKFFTINIELKLASFVIAVALWFFVILSGRAQVVMDIPVQFVNLPEKFEILDHPKEISVTVEGQERLLKYMQRNEINVVMDLGDAKEGRSFHTISADNIKLPKSFLITHINPETISITIEEQLTKSVSVKPNIRGIPEKGFKITEIKVEPDRVTLEGPRSAVAKIRSLKTEPIDISGISSDLLYKANLQMSNENIKKNTDKVEVTITIETQKKETSK